MFMGEEGREMVGKYAQDVTDYYCMASELDNHCVRESACHSIAEMAEKVQHIVCISSGVLSSLPSNVDVLHKSITRHLGTVSLVSFSGC